MKLYDTVLKLLEDYEQLRNSDKKLIWCVWYKQGLSNTSITKEDFLRAKSSESITRARRKVQELHPELQATSTVKMRRAEIERQKGTFVYREQLKIKQ